MFAGSRLLLPVYTNSVTVSFLVVLKLCSSKVENSEEKTRRLRIGLSAEFLYSMTCLVVCSHRKSHLKSFLQGIFIGRIGGGTFWRLRQKHQRKQTSERGVSSLREASGNSSFCSDDKHELTELTNATSFFGKYCLRFKDRQSAITCPFLWQ